MIGKLTTFITTSVLVASVFAQNQPQSPTVDSVSNAKQNSKPKLKNELDLSQTVQPSPGQVPQTQLAPGQLPSSQVPPATVAPSTNLPITTNTKAVIKTVPEQKNTNSFKRDPFRLPKYLIDKITYKPPPPIIENQVIDDRVEPIMRWPAKEYLLVGIIWEVKNPKALIKDLQGRVHVVKLRDKLGNKEGVVTAIKEGAITVTEKKIPFVLRLKK